MLVFTGDINLTDGFFDMGFGVGSVITRGKNPFAKLNRKVDDFWIGNLECVCADFTSQTGSHAKQFRISPESLSGVNHLDFYGVANNHVMQHGNDAYKETRDPLEGKGIYTFGDNSLRTRCFNVI